MRSFFMFCFLICLMFVGVAFAQTTAATPVVVTPDVTDGVISYLTAHLGTWFPIMLQILGIIIVIGSAIDAMLPDKGATVTKILSIPILGTILHTLTKFSPFNFDTTQKTPPSA